MSWMPWVIFNLTVFIFIIIFTLNFSLCNLAKLGSTENLPTLFILLGLILQTYKLSLMGKLQGRKFLFLSIKKALIIKQSLSTPLFSKINSKINLSFSQYYLIARKNSYNVFCNSIQSMSWISIY